MVLCIKCHNPIKKLPVWLSRVKVGFVCDSCKTRPVSQQGHARKPTPPPESVDLELDDTVPLPSSLADLSTEIVDVVEKEVEIPEEPILAVVSMEESSAEVEAAAEAEPEPARVEEVSKKRKAAKPEAPLPEVAIPDDAPHTLLAKKLLQVLAPEGSEGKPKGKKATEEKKAKPEPAPEPKAKKAKAEAASEPKAKKVAEKEAKPEPAPEPKAKKAKAEAAPEPKAKKVAEKEAKSPSPTASKPKKTAAKKV